MSNQVKLDKILKNRGEKFEKAFERLDKESLGYLTPKQVKKFWEKKEADMDLYKRVEERFGLDKEDKKIDLTEFKQIQAVRVLGKLADDPQSEKDEGKLNRKKDKDLNIVKSGQRLYFVFLNFNFLRLRY